VAAGRLPVLLLAFYSGASVIAFIVYAWDKSAAQRDEQRTPEKTLHMLALIGGWPGALLAQQVLRHKSSKAEFLRVFWVTVGINCAALAYLYQAHF
jgi:uncharacterized membrane protein YsdA (DUF1294 family)